MKFKLKTFASGLMKKYHIKRKSNEYDIDNPKNNYSSQEMILVVYTKSRRERYLDNKTGSDEKADFNGKVEIKYGLKDDDYILIEKLMYKVTNLTPRPFSDYCEFELQLTKDLAVEVGN